MSLPEGFRVRLAHAVVRADAGRLLVGGSPLTAMRLTNPALELLGPDGVTVRDANSEYLAERLLSTNLGVPDLAMTPTVGALNLTVVIPVRDRPRQLDRALAALRPLRCVVVDDDSDRKDLVAEVANRHGARLVVLKENRGPAGARNAGLATLTTPYVAFVDSDVEAIAPDLLSLSRHFADPRVVLVGPKVVGIVRSARPRWFERYDAEASSLTLGDVAGVVRPGAAVAWLPSACLVARAAALTGGFDDRLRVGEDVDLVWRLTEAGHRVRYDPTVQAHHDARPTVRGWLGRKFVYGTGGAELASRHGDKVAPAVLTPTYAIAAAGVLLRNRWSAPIALVAAVHGWHGIRRALPAGNGSDLVAARLAIRGLGWSVRQEAGLLLRHWWPLAAMGAVRSTAVRRALVSALVVDAAVMVAARRRVDIQVALPVALAGRRLEDLAYGSGLWWGALRRRSPAALLTRQPGQR